ncbi:large conductance mechanosensitive channel protein MscL [Lacrimispora sp.]|uniref:large conductance mechanosensitive channel protein MscL n=1 Tax=Lacrimispora sp. TaxID=2719234 RepID=UPI0028980D53|nr:large conductance mechanosensitive channel protein MscL [Lacrimispora sp.]
MGNKKGIIAEFKEFVLRGNVVDLAVGVIIGAAFQAIVNSLVKDIISPLIGVITGGVDFTNKFVPLYAVPAGADVSTLSAAQALGPVFAYGSFITAVINFLIMASVIFMMIKVINTLRGKKQQAEPAAATDKECPYCFTRINVNATRCPNCTSKLPVQPETVQED